jgi:hypothetical protein
MDPQEPNQAGPSTPPKPVPAAEQPPNPESTTSGDATMQEAPKEPQEEPLPQEILELNADDILARARLIENEIKVSNFELPPSSPLLSVSTSRALSRLA